MKVSIVLLIMFLGLPPPAFSTDFTTVACKRYVGSLGNEQIAMLREDRVPDGWLSGPHREVVLDKLKKLEWARTRAFTLTSDSMVMSDIARNLSRLKEEYQVLVRENGGDMDLVAIGYADVLHNWIRENINLRDLDLTEMNICLWIVIRFNDRIPVCIICKSQGKYSVPR